jgi:hypothetical protein
MLAEQRFNIGHSILPMVDNSNTRRARFGNNFLLEYTYQRGD